MKSPKELEKELCELKKEMREYYMSDEYLNRPQPQSKWELHNHIIGKVYDLTQENMNAMIKDIELLNEANKVLLEDNEANQKILIKLIESQNELEAENEKLKNQINDVRSCLLQITSLQEKIESAKKVVKGNI